MALSITQIAAILYKKLRGVGHTSDSRQFFEEPYLGRQAIFPSQIWTQASSIPTSAPAGMTDGQITGVVKRIINRTMTAVGGTTSSFYLVDLINAIPFNYGDGSYNYAFSDSSGNAIPFGTGDWVLDSDAGVITFEGTVPANMPPKISAFIYVGTFGLSGAVTGTTYTEQGSTPAAPAAGSLAVYAKTDDKLYYQTSAGVEKAVGSGSGDATNLDSNANGASGVTDWVQQTDQAQVLSDTTNNWLTGQTGFPPFYVGMPIIFPTTAPAPLVAGVTYYLIASGRVAATPGGSAITLTGGGFFYAASTLPGDQSVTNTTTTYTGNSQTDLIIAAATPSGSGFTLSKNAVSTYAHNLKRAFVLPTAFDINKTINLQFDYTYAAGGYPGSLEIWIREVSKNRFFRPNDYTIDLTKNIINTQFTAGTTVSYELWLRDTSRAVTAWSTLLVGNINLSVYRLPLVNAFQQIPDSIFRMNGFNFATATTNTAIICLTGGTVHEQTGDAIQYISDAVNGDRFVALRDGIYAFSSTCDIASNTTYGFSKNSANLTTTVTSIPLVEKLALSYGDVPNTTWTGALKTGDIVRFHGGGTTTSATVYSVLTVQFFGSLKSVVAVQNQKLSLPQSELRFEGTTGLGSTDTTVVKFNTQVKTFGDAFTITNVAANGTIIKVNRDGWLAMDAAVIDNSGGSSSMYLTRNQMFLTTAPVASEVLQTGAAAGANFSKAAGWSGRVFAGDLFRVTSVGAIQSDFRSHWNLLFSDTNINLALNTVQPQWSQGDSYVNVNTSALNGSTNANVVRWSNLEASSGTDITYTDDAALGGYFTINTAGIYSFCLTGGYTASAAQIAITKNQPTLATAISTPGLLLAADTTAGSNYYGCATGQSYLAVGDKIYCATNAGNMTLAGGNFKISKVGKPNLIAADVTSFMNFKQQDFDYLSSVTSPGGLTTTTGVLRFTTVAQTNKGILSYDSSTGKFTALKACRVNLSTSLQILSAAGSFYILLNGVEKSRSNTPPNAAQYQGVATGSFNLAIGDYLQVSSGSYNIDNSTGSNSITVLAVADTDTVVSASKQVSSDSVAFTFKSTVIDGNVDAVGTFNTYQYNTTSSVVATLSTSAPTQTTASMNTNGFQLFARGYTSTSTAASPARVDIFIGKGLKGYQVLAYGGLGKTLGFGYNRMYNGAATEYGTSVFYNENTGILTLDAGVAVTSAANRWVDSSANGTYANGYFVVNASANPALVSATLSDPRNIRGTQTSGQSIPTGTTPTQVTWNSQLEGLAGYLNGSSQYLATKAGRLEVASTVQFASMTTVAGAQFQLFVYKNGVIYKGGITQLTTGVTTGTYGVAVNDVVTVVPGDLIDIRVSQTTGAARTLSTGAGLNILTVAYKA